MKRWMPLTGKIFVPLVSAGVLLTVSAATHAAGTNAKLEKVEKHFTVKGRPVVCIHNIGNGRIEVKSWKNSEVVVTATRGSEKISVETEQAGNRIEVGSNLLDASAKPNEMEADFQLTVPEETELELKTQTGLIYVEQVTGDMTLDSVAGDVHLKEVSGYIIVTTTGGSLVCTQCAGKLEFNTISGNAQVLQPTLDNVKLRTMTGNILFDGDFVHTGLYSMRSGKGLVEVRFSGNDSFDLNAETATGTVDNQAAEYLKPDSHGVRHTVSRFSKGLFGTVGSGFAKVELSSYSGTIRILKRD
jgi:DUF4097 and DUF4098 domain-containing protein YvlB